MRVRRPHVLLAGGFALLAAGGLFACSLGLDESLIGQQNDSGFPDRNPLDAEPTDSGNVDSSVPLEASVCTKDEDCKGTGGCLTARCDVPRKACVLDVCRKPACSSAKCEMPGSTCDAPKPYPFKAGQFPVGAGIGCGGSLARCFAAVYPYVFVGTPNGVLAFQASDPAATAPLAIPVTGLGFVPNQILASGSRVFFLGGAAGTGTTSRLQIAYADVTPDPFAAKIPVTTVLADFNRPATDPVFLFPRENDSAMLIDSNVATAYPTAAVAPPLTEPTVITSTGLTFTTGSSPYAVSGSRLIMGQVNAAQQPIVAFVNGAGSASPSTAPDVPLTNAGPVSGPLYLSQSADGAVFFSFVSLNPVPLPPNPQTIRAAHGYFLVGNATADFDQTQGLDLEVYTAVPLGTPTTGPAAMIDANTALVTTAITTNTQLTNVGFVTKSPLGFVKNADGTLRRFQLTLPVSQLAAAGSGGLGYVLAVDPAAPTAPTVYVFDQGCAP